MSQYQKYAPRHPSRSASLTPLTQLRLYNFSRIPLAGSDAFSVIAPQAPHLTVMIDDFIYSIDVFPKATSPEDITEPLPVGVIEQRIRSAVDDARSRIEAGEQAVKVGILTADERDTWTKVSAPPPSLC
jgi:carnitine O-acetyltransferase